MEHVASYIRTTKRTSSSKSAPEPEETRPLCSLIEVLSTSESSVGGLKEVIAIIEGNRVYSQLKMAGGQSDPFDPHRQFQHLLPAHAEECDLQTR